MMPALRAAVERHWPDTQRAAASVLGDVALAAEIMERAIEQAVAYLAEHPPKIKKMLAQSSLASADRRCGAGARNASNSSSLIFLLLPKRRRPIRPFPQ